VGQRRLVEFPRDIIRITFFAIFSTWPRRPAPLAT
jgi:hypothetical protein